MAGSRMGVGAGIGSAAGGFGRGLAKALLMNRERSDQKSREAAARADRAFQYQLPILMQIGEETGDWTPAEEAFAKMFPEQAKGWAKKGSPFRQLAPALLGQGSQQSPQDRTAMEQEQDSAILAGNPAATPELPNRAEIGPAVLAPARKTLFGVEMPTPEEKMARQGNMQTAAMQQQIEARRSVAMKMGMTPEAATRYALFGTEATERPTTPRAPTDFDEGLARYMTSQGKDGQPASSADELAYRKSVAESTRAPQQNAAGTADSDLAALAAMVASSPAVLQGKTPTLQGQVLAHIAASPELRAQFEETRMAPIRAGAEQVVTALKDLVRVDASGKVIGLTPGAIGLYGRGIGRVSRFLPGTAEATAKAALDQITGNLTLDIIKQMKEQSQTGATGFGSLAIRELNVLENSATMLKGEISEARALQELTALWDRYNKVLQPSAAAQPPAGRPAGATPPSTPGTIDLNTPIFIGPDGKPSFTSQ